MFTSLTFSTLYIQPAYYMCSQLQALGLKRDDTFSVTMLGHCIEMYIGDSDAYIGKFKSPAL